MEVTNTYNNYAGGSIYVAKGNNQKMANETNDIDKIGIDTQ